MWKDSNVHVALFLFLPLHMAICDVLCRYKRRFRLPEKKAYINFRPHDLAWKFCPQLNNSALGPRTLRMTSGIVKSGGGEVLRYRSAAPAKALTSPLRNDPLALTVLFVK
jgi:hypothetical protein